MPSSVGEGLMWPTQHCSSHTFFAAYLLRRAGVQVDLQDDAQRFGLEGLPEADVVRAHAGEDAVTQILGQADVDVFAARAGDAAARVEHAVARAEAIVFGRDEDGPHGQILEAQAVQAAVLPVIGFTALPVDVLDEAHGAEARVGEVGQLGDFAAFQVERKQVGHVFPVGSEDELAVVVEPRVLGEIGVNAVALVVGQHVYGDAADAVCVGGALRRIDFVRLHDGSPLSSLLIPVG